MLSALPLAAYAALTGIVAPRALLRARWPHQAPRTAVLVWQALTVSFVMSLALTVHTLAATDRHLHSGPLVLLTPCGLHAGGTAHDVSAGPPDLLALPAALVAGALPVGHYAVALARAALHRRRHAALLRLVARPLPRHRALVLDHDVPAAYCLPGFAPRIVLTSAVLGALTPPQVGAIVEHERAHIAGRHHLALTAAQAFARVFPFLPLARHARDQTALLLEMAADDRALRSHTRETLATALCEVAAGGAQPFALAMGGADTLTRVRRILAPAERPPLTASLAVSISAVAEPLVPLMIACGICG